MDNYKNLLKNNITTHYEELKKDSITHINGEVKNIVDALDIRDITISMKEREKPTSH